MKVSLILITFNGYKNIKKNLNSVLNQSFKEYELIIIDDGSNIKTKNYLSKLKNKKLRVITHKINKGPAAARNTGIKNAKGEYICVIADDYYLPEDWLKEAYYKISSSQVDLITHGFKCIQKSIIAQTSHRYYKYSINSKFRHAYVIKFNDFELIHVTLPASAAMLIRKTVFSKTGLYDESLRVGEDSEMSVRFQKKNILMYHDKQNTIIRYYSTNFFKSLKTYYSYGKTHKFFYTTAIHKPFSTRLKDAFNLNLFFLKQRMQDQPFSIKTLLTIFTLTRFAGMLFNKKI
jgi:glycosyltransferase involved in cell wall biosynthesis